MTRIIKRTMIRDTIQLALFIISMGSFQILNADDLPTINLSIDYATKYIWRGQELNDEPVIQPSFTISEYGLSFNIWGNYDLTDGGRADNFSEIDYTIDYELSLDQVSIGVGGIYYAFPGDVANADTVEIFTSLSFNTIFEPSITYYHDLDEIDGVYLHGSVGHTVNWSDQLSMSLGASLAFGTRDYNKGYFEENGSGLNDVTFSVGLDYSLDDHSSIGFNLIYSELVDSDVERNVNNGTLITPGGTIAPGDSDNLYGSINFTHSF